MENVVENFVEENIGREVLARHLEDPSLEFGSLLTSVRVLPPLPNS